MWCYRWCSWRKHSISNMATVSSLATVQSKEQEILISVLWKRQSKAPDCYNRYVGFVTDRSERKNGSFEMSHVLLVRGNTYRQVNRLWQNTGTLHWVNVHLFAFVWPQFLSLSLFTFFASSINRVLLFLQCSFHSYSSCSTITREWLEKTMPQFWLCRLLTGFCCALNQPWFSPGKSSPVADQLTWWKWGLQGTNLVTDDVHMCFPHMYFTPPSIITSFL